MKVILTGSSGFVGQNLSKFLKAQDYDISSLNLRLDNFQIENKGLALIHLAGKAHDTKNTSAESEYLEVNTELTKKVFDQFLKSEIRDFFFFSSVKATADSVEGILTEENLSNPQTPYGKSKLEAENYLLSQNLPEGKRLFIVRPCMIHGPGNKGNLNLLYKIVLKNIPWPLAVFENKRSFLGIDNLNFLIQNMIENPKIESGIYNFSDDQGLSTNEIISIISKTLEKKRNFLRISKKMIFYVAKIGDFSKLPLNSERLKKLTENYEVSNMKIKKALNIEKLPYTAEEGMRKTIRSFMNE